MVEENQEIHANDLVWAYHPINPETSYVRERYLGSQDQLNSLEDYVSKLQKDPNDPKTRGKLTGILFGDKNLGARLPIDQLRFMAKSAVDNGSDEMAKYVRRNLEGFFDEEVLTDDGLQHMVLNPDFPIYIIEDKPEHNRLVNIVADFKSVNQIAKSGDVGKMSKYIAGKLKDKKAPEWVTKTFSALAGIPGFTEAIFNRYAKASNQILAQNILVGEGENARLNRKLMEDLIKNSVKAAEEAYDEETDEGKKGDIWSDNLKPILYSIAREPFPFVKEKWERDEFGEQKDREDERHSKRMAA